MSTSSSSSVSIHSPPGGPHPPPSLSSSSSDRKKRAREEEQEEAGGDKRLPPRPKNSERERDTSTQKDKEEGVALPVAQPSFRKEEEEQGEGERKKNEDKQLGKKRRVPLSIVTWNVNSLPSRIRQPWLWTRFVEWLHAVEPVRSSPPPSLLSLLLLLRLSYSLLLFPHPAPSCTALRPQFSFSLLFAWLQRYLGASVERLRAISLCHYACRTKARSCLDGKASSGSSVLAEASVCSS